MEICGHLIKESEIVGAGPLMVELYPEINMQQMFNRRRQFFLLHLQKQSVKIESEWLDLGYGPEEKITDREKKARQDYITWKETYNEAKARIENLINQPLPL